MGDSSESEREREIHVQWETVFLHCTCTPGKGSLPIRLSQGGDFASFGLLIALVIEGAARRFRATDQKTRTRTCRGRASRCVINT